MDTRILKVFETTSIIFISFYGLWNIISETLFSVFPIAVLGIAICTFIIYMIRVPFPDQAAVDAIVGKDPAKDNLDADDFVMRVVAHRGAGLDAPENSLVAFRMCSEKGCFGVEFDVTLSADNVPIIFHDDTLERLTDSPKSVRQMTWEELANVDISVKHPLKEKFVNTHIAKLEELVLQCLNNKQRMFIDIKEYNKTVVNILLDLYKKFPELESKAVCSSFFPNVIYWLRRANPKIVCSIAWRPYIFSYESYSSGTTKDMARHKTWYKHMLAYCLDLLYAWFLPRIIYYVIGTSIVLLHKDVCSGKAIHDWRDKGVRVIAWTVNQPVEKQHFSRILKITYMTDTLIGESTAHLNTNARSNQ